MSETTTNAPAQATNAPTPTTLHAKLLDYLERAGWSAGQQFFAILLASGAVAGAAGLPWKLALVSAAGAAVASLILTFIQYLVQDLNTLQNEHQAFLIDLSIRTGKTFLASVAGSVAAAKPFDIVKFDWPTTLNVAAVAAITAFGKGFLAGSGSPSSGPDESRTPSTLSDTNYQLAARTS